VAILLNPFSSLFDWSAEPFRVVDRQWFKFRSHLYESRFHSSTYDQFSNPKLNSTTGRISERPPGQPEPGSKRIPKFAEIKFIIALFRNTTFSEIDC
jgi:hypothetical protein